MRWLLIVSLFGVWINGAEVVAVGDKYKNSDKCRACHNHIVNQWNESWHSKSHYGNDEYFKKTIDYMSRKTHKSVGTLKVECANCHNPRISVTKTSAEYEALASINAAGNTKVDKALGSDTIVEGINCVVCHNIDQIHDGLPDSERGINRVTWMKSGVMSGPYDDAKSPYHQVEHRDFMDTNPNQLCFVCHANDTSEEGHRFTNMKVDFKSGSKACVDCHMSPRKEGVAATLRDAKGNQHKRQIRTHGFIGAHSESMWQGALSVSGQKTARGLEITLNNSQPHALPNGFGSREILIEATYTNNSQLVKNETLSLTSKFLSKRGAPTIPHLADKSVENVSIPAQGSKTFTLPLYANADRVVVIVSYRLVNDEVRELLELKDPIWSKKMVIQKVTIKL
jgi:hypothetical protein